MKFKDGFVEKYQRKVEQEQEQKKLKVKHKIEDDDKIIVEKSSAVKYLTLSIGKAIQLAATVVILGLAIVGLISLIYLRSELMIVFRSMGL